MSANQASLWHCLRLSGVKTPVNGYGELLLVSLRLPAVGTTSRMASSTAAQAGARCISRGPI